MSSGAADWQGALDWKGAVVTGLAGYTAGDGWWITTPPPDDGHSAEEHHASVAGELSASGAGEDIGGGVDASIMASEVAANGAGEEASGPGLVHAQWPASGANPAAAPSSTGSPCSEDFRELLQYLVDPPSLGGSGQEQAAASGANPAVAPGDTLRLQNIAAGASSFFEYVGTVAHLPGLNTAAGGAGLLKATVGPPTTPPAPTGGCPIRIRGVGTGSGEPPGPPPLVLAGWEPLPDVAEAAASLKAVIGQELKHPNLLRNLLSYHTTASCQRASVKIDSPAVSLKQCGLDNCVDGNGQEDTVSDETFIHVYLPCSYIAGDNLEHHFWQPLRGLPGASPTKKLQAGKQEMCYRILIQLLGGSPSAVKLGSGPLKNKEESVAAIRECAERYSSALAASRVAAGLSLNEQEILTPRRKLRAENRAQESAGQPSAPDIGRQWYTTITASPYITCVWVCLEFLQRGKWYYPNSLPQPVWRAFEANLERGSLRLFLVNFVQYFEVGLDMFRVRYDAPHEAPQLSLGPL
jgi:hypothetical protein